MVLTAIKLLSASMVITGTSWLANQRPQLAGFLMALPISSMIALAFNYAEFSNPEKSSEFARAILISVPLSLVFFVPFLIQLKWPMPFWVAYGLGVVLLGGAYLLTRLWS